ncbi:MAG: hypothetical protein A2015_14245 [Spirochaetes bacterium GWF1_31_7]|nr:MAG: hypothetical protein A2Y30_03505 [Spirochaetes bacterium GWE1_32_154]OHD45266.1 MAG: hypothetical protein A2Y29_02440 [Spirochaetes bacterium GWE2_31_10]OHD50561.1 MAG: hypothetical protein A2015_14245 [Spirochaetes bacterium GWF1_31_7]OHD79007.1 MAG: hypothetical protein A2355_14325 [Spirochaetes bacterium RIFOXYB1_FULL_32_8]HBD94585.1 hypothetical protein [Spirochaetia bacterium]
MDPIFAGLLSVVCMVIIFIVNLIKGIALFPLLVKTILGGIFVFLIIGLVQFIFSSVLNIDFSAKKQTPEDVEGEVGNNVDFTVHDEDHSENNESNFQNEMNDYKEESYANEDSGSNDESNSVDSVGFEETDFTNIGKIDDYDKDIDNYENTGYDSSGYDLKSSSNNTGKNTEELINQKMGFNASVEDMAKAVRTTLKRE